MRASMRKSQVIGLILWRGGSLFVASLLLYEGAWRLLQFIDIPMQLKVGIVLTIVGSLLVLLSLLAERITDARKEGDLRE